MGLFDFLFLSAIINRLKKTHRNTDDTTIHSNDNYARGYEDGYEDCGSDHDFEYDDYHDQIECEEYEEFEENEEFENEECYDDESDW